MKNFQFKASQLTANLRDKIAAEDQGIYVVYGTFIDGTALNITRLHTGKFSDIMLRIDNPSSVDPDAVTYLVPIPEYIVSHEDPNYAKYLNIHFVPEADIEDPEVMMRKFCEAYTRNLSSAAADDAAQAAELQAEQMKAAGQGLDQMESALSQLEQSSALVATLSQQAQRESGLLNPVPQDVEEESAVPVAAQDPNVVTDVEPKSTTES